MIEPLTAIAVAGNVLQFAELGTKLLLKACEVYKSTDGLDDEYRDLGIIAENVRNCNTVLEQFALMLPPEHKSSAHNLLEANNFCLKISTEFLQLLEQAAPKSEDHKISAAFKSAFTNLRKQNKIARLDKNINHARSNLLMNLLAFSTTEIRTMKNSILDGIGTSRSEVLHQMQEVSDNLRGDVRDLIESFSAMELNFQNQLTAFRQSDCSLTKEAKQSKLEVSLRTENLESKRIRQKIHELDITTTKAQAKVMDSLFFSQMHTRRDQIAEAHPQTLKWIFQRGDAQLAWHEFAGWLETYDNQRIYWIRGKAGSGKSTLLRALDGQIKCNLFKGWAEDFPLIQVGTYFWHAGSPIQRSVAGLLRSLLYQAFELLPGILPDVIWASRWNSALGMGSQMNDWTIQELRGTLTRFIQLTSEQSEAPSRVLLLVDGLDEYEGSDEERQRMIDLFAEITESPHVKVCLSSRPWVVYVQRLQQYPSLRLESLTKNDIELFVHDRLFSDKLIREMLDRRPLLQDELSKEIVHKAKGVFLWVRLVVRDLLQVVRDGGSASLVRRTLREMPSELNAYFTRMLDSIDPRYRKDSSMIIQFALCSLLKVTTPSTLPHSDSVAIKESLVDSDEPALLQPFWLPQPLLLHLHYLDEESPPDFALSDDFKPLDLRDAKEVDYELKVLDRRLTSRSMELLEVVSSTSTKPLPKGSFLKSSYITFFHRSAKTFFRLHRLNGSSIAIVMGLMIPTPFSVTRCSPISQA
ncbi:hypothetical protein AYO22_02380 [Fonsecaea multimorphosa]|nr:hypothetical protein AYO22_02380 [Fonsecaea multimorphosa]